MNPARCRRRSVVAGNRPFLLFAALHSTYLLSYNQLYLAVPVELARVGAPPVAITWVSAAAAVLVVVAQVPVTRMTSSGDRALSLRAGYLCLALGFAAVAIAAPFAPPAGALAYVPLACFVVLLHVGGILVLPTARDAVAHLADGKGLGTYLGFLATAGGVAVLVGSTVAGRLLDGSATAQPAAGVAWWFLAALPLVSAVAVGPFCARHLPVGDR